MPPQRETSRTLAESEQNGELIEAVINSVINFAFVVGSIFFFPGVPEWQLLSGDIIFIVGSFVSFWIAATKLAREGLGGTLKMLQQREKHSEAMLALMYCVASLIFCIGSFLYMPGIFSDEETQVLAERVGAWIFVVGSFGFVVASFYSMEALGHHGHAPELDSETEPRVYFMHRAALMAGLVGSNLFVVGSFLFRPGLNTHCKLLQHIRQPENDTAVCQWLCRNAEHFEASVMAAKHKMMMNGCVDNLYFGTLCYLIGSILFFVASLLELKMILLKHASMKQTHAKKAD